MGNNFIFFILLFCIMTSGQTLEVTYTGSIQDVEKLNLLKNATHEQIAQLKELCGAAQESFDLSDIKLITAPSGLYIFKIDRGLSSSKNRFKNTPLLGIGKEYRQGDRNMAYEESAYHNKIITHTYKELVAWEITGKTKEILGYTCYKAVPTYKSDALSTTNTAPKEVWFCPELSYSGSPHPAINLPGLVLQTVSDIVIITATNIEVVAEQPKLKDYSKKDLISYEKYYALIKGKSKAIEARINK